MRKNIKRSMTAVLAAAMIMSFAACGNSETGTTNRNTESTQAATEASTSASTQDNARNNSQSAVAESTTQAGIEDYYMAEAGACEEEYDFNGATSYAAKKNFAIDGDVIPPEEGGDFYTNEYNDLDENPWMTVKTAPLSTFAADVDTAAYSQIRSGILNGWGVDPGQVRIEEMINYFHYDYETPKKGDKFAVHTEFADCPWNEDTQLALVSLNTEQIDFSDAPESNIVFLIDTSGSMSGAPLNSLKMSLRNSIKYINSSNYIGVVSYSSNVNVDLELAKFDLNQQAYFMGAVDSLTASGILSGSSASARCSSRKR